MVFYESTNHTGIYDLFMDLTSTNSTSYPVAKFTRDANNAMANFKMIADRASGKWQNDDTNQPDYPIVKLDLVANQRDYPFTVDGTVPNAGFATGGNQILDIHRVECAIDTTGKLQELAYFDQSEVSDSLGTLATITGVPFRYDKLANAVFLDPTPNFSSTASTNSGGLWLYVNRSPAYFLSTATTQKPGIPEQFHEYIAYRPAMLYAIAKGLPQKNDYFAVVKEIERQITKYFKGRDKGEHEIMTFKPISYI